MIAKFKTFILIKLLCTTFIHFSQSRIIDQPFSQNTALTSKLSEKFKNLIIQQKKHEKISTHDTHLKSYPKDWNLIVYMAANNNLHRFALHNFRQMLRIGSTEHINILLQIDEFGESEVTRFYIEQNNATIYETVSNTIEAISGTPESLYGFLRWAITTFPAKHNAVVLWNHGSGIKDPNIWGKYYGGNRNNLFYKNTKTGLLQLKRKTTHDQDSGVYDYESDEKGIAFNEIHQTYINNQELRSCLEKACIELLNNKKFDIIFMDACHMAMVEIGSELKKIAHYMVGSEEIEPGTGYNYSFLLEPFLVQSFLPSEFARHAVSAYKAEYTDAFADFTQVAVCLDNFEQFEKKLFKFSQLLLQFLNADSGNFSQLRRMRKSIRYTTEFFDEDYIDLHHFLKSLMHILQNINSLDENSDQENEDVENSLIRKLEQAAHDCLREFELRVIASTSGVNLVRAGGLGLYHPKKMLHHSYLKTHFSQTTRWSDFLAQFVRMNRE